MIGRHFALWQHRRFLRATEHPLQAQGERLRRILRAATNTAAGRQWGFGELARLRSAEVLVQAYQDRVPVRSHAEMRPELDRVYSGDWQALCPSRPVFFSMTAGSTGRFKYIPVTRELRGDVGAAAVIFLGALYAACPELGALKCQFLVGSAEGGSSPTAIPQGFASGYNYKRLPRMLRRGFVLPYEIFTLADAEDRAYAAGRLLAGHPGLGALGAISPVNLINLRQALERNAERLCDDLAAGTLTLAGGRTGWRAPRNRRLAEQLRASWRSGQPLPNELLFPALKVLICWQGGNMGYYLKELDERFGAPRHFELPISASEGVFAIPHGVDRAGGILAITTHFLEFLPANGGTGRALRADQLELGGCYDLVLTNSGGLYRYDMEDLVKVTGFQRTTPIVEFVSKRSRQVAVANERLTELDVTQAMRAASQASGHWVPEFLFVPCSDRKYRVLLDGTASALAGRLGPFAEELERQLRLASRGYDFEREDALLLPLELECTAPGRLRHLLAERHAGLALPNAQIKPMHLTSEFDAHLRCCGESHHAV